LVGLHCFVSLFVIDASAVLIEQAGLGLQPWLAIFSTLNAVHRAPPFGNGSAGWNVHASALALAAACLRWIETELCAALAVALGRAVFRAFGLRLFATGCPLRSNVPDDCKAAISSLILSTSFRSVANWRSATVRESTEVLSMANCATYCSIAARELISMRFLPSGMTDFGVVLQPQIAAALAMQR
jgi:hypothetical protein